MLGHPGERVDVEIKFMRSNSSDIGPDTIYVSATVLMAEDCGLWTPTYRRTPMAELSPRGRRRSLQSVSHEPLGRPDAPILPAAPDRSLAFNAPIARAYGKHRLREETGHVR